MSLFSDLFLRIMSDLGKAINQSPASISDDAQDILQINLENEDEVMIETVIEREEILIVRRTIWV